MMPDEILLMKLKTQAEDKTIKNNQLVRGLLLWEEQKNEVIDDDLIISIFGKEGSGMSTFEYELSKALKP